MVLFLLLFLLLYLFTLFPTLFPKIRVKKVAVKGNLFLLFPFFFTVPKQMASKTNATPCSGFFCLLHTATLHAATLRAGQPHLEMACAWCMHVQMDLNVFSIVPDYTANQIVPCRPTREAAIQAPGTSCQTSWCASFSFFIAKKR